MKFCPESRARFNNDLAYMNEAMVQEWNSIVCPEDTVYILGDVAFLPAAEAVKILKNLNGSKILIEGNHDRKLLNDPVFRKCFKEVHKYHTVNYNGQRIIMCHFPFLEWDQMHRGALHFFGHLHGSPTGQEQYRCRDVGMDATGKIVISMEEAINSVCNNSIKPHHVKGEL